jgi:hypothetical protein
VAANAPEPERIFDVRQDTARIPVEKHGRCRECRRPLAPTVRGTVCPLCNAAAIAAAERLFRAVRA